MQTLIPARPTSVLHRVIRYIQWLGLVQTRHAPSEKPGKLVSTAIAPGYPHPSTIGCRFYRLSLRPLGDSLWHLRYVAPILHMLINMAQFFVKKIISNHSCHYLPSLTVYTLYIVPYQHQKQNTNHEKSISNH